MRILTAAIVIGIALTVLAPLFAIDTSLEAGNRAAAIELAVNR
jgi:hypothetical protein